MQSARLDGRVETADELDAVAEFVDDPSGDLQTRLAAAAFVRAEHGGGDADRCGHLCLSATGAPPQDAQDFAGQHMGILADPLSDDQPGASSRWIRRA